MSEGALPGIAGLVVVELDLRRSFDLIRHPVQLLTEHFALCPGLEYDRAAGKWSYVSRWWHLCHIWVGEDGGLEGRGFIVVEQELPIEPGVIDRPALALDLDVCRQFAQWLERHHDWSTRHASLNYEEYWAVVGEEIERYRDAPNLWEPPAADSRHLGVAPAGPELTATSADDQLKRLQ